MRWPAVLVVLLVCGPVASAWAAPPGGTAARPRVQALRKDWSWVEGALERFDQGVYTVESRGASRSFREDEVRTIAFEPQPVKARERPKPTRSIDELIGELAKDPTGAKNVEAIQELASQPDEAIGPLLEAVRRNAGLSMIVGTVLSEMGVEVLPRLARVIRDDRNKAVRDAAARALRSRGTDAFAYLKDLLGDSDPEVRKLAAGLFYNLSVQSGVIFPAALDEPLIKALKDPNAEVRGNAAWILGWIGRQSGRAIAPLVETMEQ